MHLNTTVLIKLLILIIVSVNMSNQELEVYDKIEGYYWRDYKGFIPKDALPGGKTSSNEITYIAQVLTNKLLVPGEIRQSENRAYYEWGFQEFSATENIKILCTTQPDEFRWLPTTKDNFKTITNRNFISGGYEENNEMYVGRKIFDDSVIVGKVQVILPEREAVFHYPRNKKGHFDYDFEVLYQFKPKRISILFYLN